MLGVVLCAALARCTPNAASPEPSTPLSPAALAARDLAEISLTETASGLRLNHVQRVPRSALGPEPIAASAGPITHRWKLVRGLRGNVLASGVIAAQLDVRLPVDAAPGEPAVVLAPDTAHVLLRLPYPGPGEHLEIAGRGSSLRWP